jgi:hypothetical protein
VLAPQSPPERPSYGRLQCACLGGLLVRIAPTCRLEAHAAPTSRVRLASRIVQAAIVGSPVDRNHLGIEKAFVRFTARSDGRDWRGRYLLIGKQ